MQAFTPYPDVDAVVALLLFSVQAVLASQFVGLYLHGSLASGDFDPETSDIDFLVVTADELPNETLRALDKMHGRITAGNGRWSRRIEGSYIPRPALRRYDPNHARHAAVSVGGAFGVGQHHSDWVIQRHVVREHGVVVAGPAPATLIDPIPPDDLRRAVRAILREFWSLQLRDSSFLDTREYQAFAVLTMCRALYTLHHGAIVSKPASARWAQATLSDRWTILIEHAQQWRHDAQADELGETLEFIRYTLDSSSETAAT